jgi:xylitol oxidase
MRISGPLQERLSHFRAGFTPSNGVELQSEFLVPRKYALDAIDAIFGMRAEIAPLLQISEVRTIAQDDLLMSPCFKQACVGIHFTWERNLHAVVSLLPKIEKQLAAFEARPHWGKLFAMTGADLARLYGRQLMRFRELIHDFDPLGKFRNAFLERCIFGSADGRTSV